MRCLATCHSAVRAVLTAKVTAPGLPHCLSSPLHWRLTPALDCWHSRSQEYSSTFSAEIVQYWKLRRLRLNTAWIPEVAVPDTCNSAVQVGAACEQLDGDFSILGSRRGNVTINRTQNPIFFVWRHKVSRVCTHRHCTPQTYRQAPNLLWAGIFWNSLRDWRAEHCRSGRFLSFMYHFKRNNLLTCIKGGMSVPSTSYNNLPGNIQNLSPSL